MRNPESLRWWIMNRNTIRLIRRNILLVLILSFFALTLACEPETICASDNVPLVRVAFLKIGDTRRNDTLYSVSVTAENDSLLYSLDTLTQVILPINPAATTTDFYFFKDTVTDTLRLGYDIERVFISPECGFEQRYSNLHVPYTSFDSVRIRKTILEGGTDINIEILRCVNENTTTITASFVQNEGGEKVQDTVFYSSVYDDQGRVIFTDTALSAFRLPVNPDFREVQYYFERVHNGSPATDTLTVSYARFLEQLAPPCPEQTRYDSLRIDKTLTSFDSTTVLKRHLNTTDGRNIEIFFDL